RTLLDQAARTSAEPRLRAHVEHVRGQIEAACGTPDAAYAVLTNGAELAADRDPERAARMLTEAGQIAWAVGDLARLADAGRRLANLPAADSAARLVMGLSSFLHGDTARAA